ncbi:MAG: Arc family DNA-binding protein [Firmicutes bacterium]|nr:Arc family DNA-binding protein [Bacillota bacterium]
MAAGENSSKKSFALRVDAELFAALNAWAEDELRSVNGQIEWVLREALRKEGRLPKKYRHFGEEKQE